MMGGETIGTHSLGTNNAKSMAYDQNMLQSQKSGLTNIYNEQPLIELEDGKRSQVIMERTLEN
jgi:hypothetical protein